MTTLALNGSTNVPTKRVHANVVRQRKVEIRDQLRLLLSVLRTPVSNIGYVANAPGAALRLIRREPVYFMSHVQTGKSFRIIKINLFRHMQRYGSNIGCLRSKLRTATFSAARLAEVNAAPKRIPAWRNCFTQAARNARKLISGIFSGSALAERIPPKPKLDIFMPPPGMGSFEVYSQASANSFMLFKFFYPEVFFEWTFKHRDFDLLMAALGYVVRRGTVLETKSEFLQRKLRKQPCQVNLYADFITPRYAKPKTTGLPIRIYIDKNSRYYWPEPRSAISDYPEHIDYVRRAMESHPLYKRRWEVVAERATRPFFDFGYLDPVEHLTRVLQPHPPYRYGDYVRPFHVPRAKKREGFVPGQEATA